MIMEAFFCLALLAQGFNLEIEPPIYERLDLDGVRSGMARYQCEAQGQVFSHTLTVTEVVGGFEITIARDKPQEVTLQFLMPSGTRSVTEASNAKVTAPVGSFSVTTFSNPKPPRLSQASSEKVSILGHEYSANRYVLSYENGKQGSLLVVPGLGPTGIVEATIYRGEILCHYTLVEVK